MTDNKKKMRFEFKRIRDSISESSRQSQQLSLWSKISNIGEFQKCQSCFGYVPFGSELDFIEFMKLHDKKEWAIPRVSKDNSSMTFHLWTPNQSLVQSPLGILEPTKDLPEIKPTPETLVFLPSLALSPNGDRLGYGGGFYDKYLEQYSELTKIAANFSELKSVNIPSDKHDIQADIALFP